MDHSIMTITRAKSIAYARKVDQHQQRKLGRSTSLARSCALATALASCADEPCGKLSLNEMAMVFNHRSMDADALATVDQHSLFQLYVTIDTELQRRKDAEYADNVEQLVEDIPTRTPFASCVGVDDAELEAWAVRAIHAEVLDIEEEFS